MQRREPVTSVHSSFIRDFTSEVKVQSSYLDNSSRLHLCLYGGLNTGIVLLAAVVSREISFEPESAKKFQNLHVTCASIYTATFRDEFPVGSQGS